METLAEKITPEQARKALEAEKQERMAAFQTELEALLKRYKVQLVPQASLSNDGRIVASLVAVDAPQA